MAKRFIDTGLYDDEWFMELSKDCKLLWIYMITKCDHAGIIKINEKLCKVQTDIKDIDKTIKDLGNRIVTVSEHLYFIPKFIEFQYPGFPNSKVRQQVSAMDILKKHGLIKDGVLTLTEELPDSSDNGSGTVTVIDYELVLENYHSLCPKMSKVIELNATRKGFINARHAEFGLEKITEVLRLSGESDFLNGVNDRAWKADFEWIMRPTNFLKILEGKYNNRTKGIKNPAIDPRENPDWK
jgi:hypothetical protein